MSENVAVNPEAVAVYLERAELSEREVSRRIWPELSEGAARQRLRRRRTERLLDRAEAEVISSVIGARPKWLASQVVHFLAERIADDMKVVAPGGGVIACDSYDEAAFLLGLVKRAAPGLYENVEPTATTEDELRWLQMGEGQYTGWRWVNDGTPPDPWLDQVDWLLDLDRYLDGDVELRDKLVWAKRHWIYTHVVPLYVAPARRRSDRRERQRLMAELIARAVEVDLMDGEEPNRFREGFAGRDS